MLAVIDVTLAGVISSVLASCFVLLTVPVAYSYVQHFSTLLENEVDFCKVRGSLSFSQ